MLNIWKNRFMALAMGAATISFAACGDDPPTNNPPPPEPNIWAYPEGGEIRIEYIETPGPRVVRSNVFLIDDQDTEQYPIPPGLQCTNVKTNMVWPFAESTGRVYKDVGNEVVISSANTSMTLAKTDAATKDFISRTHDVWYRFLDAMNPVEQFTPFNGAMTATVDGETYSMFMPDIYHATTFNVADGVTLQAGQDYPIAWEMPTQNTDLNTFFIVVIVQPGGAGWSHFCLGPNTGSFTIPASAIAEFPENGNFIHGVVTHEVASRGGRRFHLLGMNCLNTPYSKVQ